MGTRCTDRSARLHDGEFVANDVTRHVPTTVQCMLWGKAAGRCEFAGCNKPLWKSPVTQESVNIAQKAHIYSFSKAGPRGRRGLHRAQINDVGNLMLVCHGCHRKLDKEKDGGRYTAALLQQWKHSHERRVETVTGIAADKRSHLLLYGANIGAHSGSLSYQQTAGALFPRRYPASDTPIQLSTVNSSFLDRDPEFWSIEAQNLARKVQQRVRERIATGEIDHLSVFALAPQPLLLFLGTMLGDIVPCDLYQLHREPAGWEWPPDDIQAPKFDVARRGGTTGPPALAVAVSGTITPDRITAVLGESADIWIISVPAPHNDIIKTRGQLAQFRSLARRVFDDIKAARGPNTMLHVFPAAPISIAVELGRVRMPKADMPWRIYDQVNGRGGFVPAVDIPYGDD